MLYHFWRHHGIFPSDFYKRSAGEQIVLRAFFEHEIEEQNRVLREQGEKAMPVVDIARM